MANPSYNRSPQAKAQAGQVRPPRRSIIAAHLIHTLYGHWAANDPRGSGSIDFLAPKFAALGPIHHGRKPQHLQPSRDQLRAFHDEHTNLLNFPLIWIDDAIRIEIAAAIEETIAARRYTCYACAICRNHTHLVIRTHRDRAQTMWEHFTNRIRDRLRLRFPAAISPHHPVISARPYNVLLHTPDDVWTRVRYIEANPAKDNLPAQHWRFVTPYDNWPLHKRTCRDGAHRPGVAHCSQIGIEYTREHSGHHHAWVADCSQVGIEYTGVLSCYRSVTLRIAHRSGSNTLRCRAH